jgi:hypothetical protein
VHRLYATPYLNNTTIHPYLCGVWLFFDILEAITFNYTNIMSLKAAVGVGYEEDSFLAGVTAAEEAHKQLGGDTPSAVIVFASSKYNQEEMLKGVRSITGDALLIGSSTAGEIVTEGPVATSSVAVMLLVSDDVKFFAGAGASVTEGAHQAGKSTAEIVKNMAGGDELKSFIMIPDVLASNGAEIVRGVVEVLGQYFPVVGGASGDDFQFKKTYQYLNDAVLSGKVVGMGMSGNVHVGIGVKHGWIPVGAPMTATKAEGNVLHEVNGRPAIKMYEDYFGEQEASVLKTETLARLAITYPIGIETKDSDELLIRDPFTVDSNGSITCAAEIPQGAEIRLMIGSIEDAVRVAKVAAQDVQRQLGDRKAKAIIVFNCIARNKLFGERSGEEIAAIQEVLGRDVPLIGFYTYGEQAPIGGQLRDIKQCTSAFHNETVVIAALG